MAFGRSSQKFKNWIEKERWAVKQYDLLYHPNFKLLTLVKVGAKHEKKDSNSLSQTKQYVG